MKRYNRSVAIMIAVILVTVAFTALPAMTQEITGELGSPRATITISGKQLPAPDPKFGGEIKNDALESRPWWAPRVVPPKIAPNVLLIMTDDFGLRNGEAERTGQSAWSIVYSAKK